MSSVPGLNESPQIAKVFPVKSVPNFCTTFLNRMFFWSAFTFSTEEINCALYPLLSAILISAPTCSHIFAISLIKDILVASIAFAAYLVISAERISIPINLS